jgi:hypothetical protein
VTPVEDLELCNRHVVNTLAYARGFCEEGGQPHKATSWLLGDTVIEMQYVYLEGRILFERPTGTIRTLTFRGRYPSDDLEAVRLALTAAARHGRLVA